MKFIFCLKNYDLNYDYFNINGKYKEKQFLKNSFPEKSSFEPNISKIGLFCIKLFVS